MKKAKFQIADLLGIGMTLVVLGIGLAYGLDVMTDTAADLCDADYQTYAGTSCYQCTAAMPTLNHTSYQCYNVTNHTAPTIYTTGALNASSDALEGVAKLPSKLPLIVTVIVAAVIIGILVRYLWIRVAG